MIKKFKDIYDKYELLEEIQDGLLYLTDNLEECISGADLEEGQYSLYLNDTKTNPYRNHGSKNLRARDFIIWLKNKGY